MKKAEVVFPRGKRSNVVLDSAPEFSSGKGTKKKVKVSTDDLSVNKQSRVDNDDLFKVPKLNRSIEGKMKKIKKKNTLTSEETDLLISHTSEHKTKNVIDVLSYETIAEGMLSLGRIIKVRDHEILVSLPGRTMGSVPITSISAPYTKALETLTADGSSEDPIYGVDDLFHVDQLVSVAVIGVKREGHSVRVTLSMAPNDLQAAFTPDSICEAMIFTGAVASVEDHGYIIDIGVSGTSAFLPKANAISFIQHQNRKKPLGIGQLLKCKVVKVKASGKSGTTKAYLTLTISTKEINHSRVTLETVNNYQLLLPGMESEGTVMKTHKTGLKVDFLDMVGHIHLDHMVDSWTLPESLEIGATIFPRVLYTLPNSTNPNLTLQSKLCQKKMSVPVASTMVTLGSKVKVKVSRIEKRGLIVRFDGGERGFVSSTRCSDNSALTDEDIGKQFPVGSSHLCCVLEYSSLDNMYIASFQQSVLNQSVIRREQLSVGQVVSCELKHWKPTGAVVGVGLTKGFIPKLHFGELALKNPAMKFPVGSKFKARVCRIDLEKNQMILTAKKRLVKSKLAILSTFDDCIYGIPAEGVISRVTEFGINIYTIGGLPAFIPASKATSEDRKNLPKLFVPGQVVKFHVVNANQKENRIILSLLFDESNIKSTSIPETHPVSTELNPSKKSKKRKSNELPSSSIEPIQISNGKNEEEIRVKGKKLKKKQVLQEQIETEPPKKKKKKAEQQKDIEEDGGCLEVPGDTFFDTSYLKNKKSEADSELSEDEGGVQKKRKRNKKNKKGVETPSDQVNNTGSELKAETSEKFRANSVNDFEKLVAASPNDGKLWSSYINFVLQSSDIEYARAVASRGIQTILFREDAEKELVWKAWLSMEATYGTEESIKKVFDEALKGNDELTIYQTMAEIHERNKNVKEQERLVHLMTKKFSQRQDVWFRALTFYYKTGEVDKGRTVFKTALEKLPKTEHIMTISKTAVLEIKYGDIERGRTLLDTTLLTYPKRLDLWLLYAAQLIKKGQYDSAREVFENAVKVAFVPKRMLSLLKKYLQFEIEHGTPEKKQRVREEALKYVNSTMPHLVDVFQEGE